MTFAKSLQQAANVDEGPYAGKQVSARNVVERLFGVLISRFELLRREIMYWDIE